MAFAVAARYLPAIIFIALQTAASMARDKFYITTPIFYPNGKPHIGHAYTVIATDALARFQRLDGKDVFFLSGTDEHGLKMQQTADQEGVTPKTLADRNSAIFRSMVEAVGGSNDEFIRTTEARHYKACQAIWETMAANGDIYLDRYSGWYSVRQEAYFDEKETDARRRRRAPRAAGLARRMERGGDLLLPPVGLSGPAAGALRIQSGIRRPDGAPQRGHQLRQIRAEGPVDLAHHLQLGRAGAGRSTSTSCMCGSTR